MGDKINKSQYLRIKMTEQNISVSYYDNLRKNKFEEILKKDRPSKYDKDNREEQTNHGIAFYEEGNRIEKLTANELSEFGYFFKTGYEIAKRRAYARKLTK